jgi:hypothetical protein
MTAPAVAALLAPAATSTNVVDVHGARAAVERAEAATWWHRFFQRFRPSCVFAGSFETTYGELLPKSLATVVREIPASCALSVQRDATFLDIGSGFGAVPLFVSLATGVRSVGVEVDGCRHEIAQRRLHTLASDPPATMPPPAGRGGNLSYLHGDVRALGLRNATVVHMHSTCFSETLMRDVMALVKQAGPQVRCILDSGNLQVQPLLGAWGMPVHVAQTPLSWAPTVGMPLYYYVRADLAEARKLRPVAANLRERMRDEASHTLRLETGSIGDAWSLGGR